MRRSHLREVTGRTGWQTLAGAQYHQRFVREIQRFFPDPGGFQSNGKGICDPGLSVPCCPLLTIAVRVYVSFFCEPIDGAPSRRGTPEHAQGHRLRSNQKSSFLPTVGLLFYIEHPFTDYDLGIARSCLPKALPSKCVICSKTTRSSSSTVYSF